MAQEQHSSHIVIPPEHRLFNNELNVNKTDDPILAKVWRKIKITAIDKVLRDLMKRTGEPYDVYMGTLDAMNDNLIAEALLSIISNSTDDDGIISATIDDITHAMFSCEESRDFLREALDKTIPMTRLEREAILDVLHHGLPVEYTKFTQALLAHDDYFFNVEQNREDPYIYFHIETKVLDVSSDYDPVDYNSSYFDNKENWKEYFQHPNGVYRIEGDTMKWAVVPHKTGVSYFLHKDCAKPEESPKKDCRNIHNSAQRVSDKLVELGCDNVIAWRLLTETTLVESVKTSISEKRLRWISRSPPETLIHSFLIISGFRTELQKVVQEAKRTKLEKKLLGTKQELRQMRIQPDRRFDVTKDLYNTAQRQTSLYYPTAQPPWSKEISPLVSFTADFLDLNLVGFHMQLLNNLIDRARSSDLSQGSKNNNKQSKNQFNARTVAVLAALNGNKVDGSMVANSAQSRGARYFYQDDDEDTKSLSTPFSNLILFATSKVEEIKAIYPVQHLRNEEVSLNNWIALRAALEFDVEKGDFSYGSPEFKKANDLVSVSLVDFIEDTPRRFEEWFNASNKEKIYVSYLTELCDEMVERTGASSPWLVREMVSRCVELGAHIESSVSGPLPLDSYGRMEKERKESTMKRQNLELPVSNKVLHFDCKVNIKGITFRLGECGRVLLHQKRQQKPTFDSRVVELLFKDQERAPDAQTALKWLERSKGSRLIVMHYDDSFHETRTEELKDDNFV